MRYLMGIWDGGGATPPNLGVARMLVQRGHDVVVLGDPTLQADIAATGARPRIWPSAPQRRSQNLADDVLRDWEARNTIEAVGRLRDRLTAGPADRFAADIADALADEPFDAVLADGILLGALVGAEGAGIPHAALVGSCYLAPSRRRPPAGRIAPALGPLGRVRDLLGYRLGNLFWRPGLRALNAARAQHGLPPLRRLWEQWEHADRVLVLTSAAFDDPAAQEPNVRYVGPVLDDVPASDVPVLPPGDALLVLVGLSSSYMDQADLLRRIAGALAGLPVRAVITTGPAIDPAEVPAAPNVRVVRLAAHRDLIPRCALVITHAGHGTLIKSLAAGVPVLCLPLGRDQPDNAARAARHGVATVLPPKASSAEIAAAVRRMLDDPAYRTAAAALGERIRAEVDGSALIPELEALARRERVSGRGGPGS